MPTKPFYNHIAGLRGLAILLIILFHLNSSCFPHGFYGVDMFLVISGYLLFLSFTRNGNSLNLKDFIFKKFLRIFPPMIVLVLVTFVAAMYFQDCEDMVDTSRTARYTLFGYVNSFLDRHQTDYFAADALENPFLHMWYLSVTIHLYLMFAVGCVVSRFIPKKLSLTLLWMIGIASFCYAYSFQLHNILQGLGLPVWKQGAPVSHYFTMPRVWSVLAGGAILLLPVTACRKKGTVLAITGLVLALLPALTPHALADYGAPIVVLGTMLIIRYMPDSVLMPVLSNKVLLWIGGISFSLYLVHMPIIAFYNIWYLGMTSWGDYAFVVVLSFVLGWLLWFFIEKRRINIFWTIGLWALAMILCVIGKETDGFKDYLRPELNSIKITPYDEWQVCKPDTLANEFDQKAFCMSDSFAELAKTTLRLPKTDAMLLQMGPASPTPSVLLVGDSHAQSMYFGFNHLCRELNVPGAFICTTFVPLWDYYIYASPRYYSDQVKAEALLKWIEANPCITHVVLAQYWRWRYKETFLRWDGSKCKMTEDVYYTALREFVKRIHDMGRKVIIIGPGPEHKTKSPTRYMRIAVRKGYSNPDMGPLSCTREEVDALNSRINPIMQKLQAEGLCTLVDACAIIPEGKPFVTYQDGKFLMYDDNHLSSDGSVMLFNILKPQFEQLLKGAASSDSGQP